MMKYNHVYPKFNPINLSVVIGESLKYLWTCVFENTDK